MADKFLDKTGLAYFWEKIKAYFQSQHTTPPEYTIVRLANEEVGYAASYVLKKDGTQVGATINIPKDYLVRSGEVKTVTVADEPYEGAVVGDKYLDFVVNTVDDSGNTSHIYIPVSDLVDAYIAGNGIQISDNNYISVKVSQQGVDHGLGVGGDGLTVRMVTPSVNGVGGTHGAMYAADKEKLDKLEIVGVFTTGSDTEPPVEGNDGLVPAPTWAERSKFLRGDGTWAEPNSGGDATDVQINGTSITSNDVANIQTEGVYNASTNKIATMSDVTGATPNVGHLKTDNSASLTPSASESFTGDINLHKVSKTGSYNDLNDKPTIPSSGDFVTSLGTSGNNVTWTKNGVTNNLTVPYATKAGTATKLGSSTVGASNIPVYLNAGVPTVTNPGESFLSWGGKNFSASYGCIDAAMVSELGACRTMFAYAAGIVIEYSVDSGATWLDYGATNVGKVGLFSSGIGFTIGKATKETASAANMLRVTLHTSAAGLYTSLNKFVIYVSTNGSTGTYCTIRCRTQQNYEDNIDTWKILANQVSVSGWSGYNVINFPSTTTYGNTKSSQYGEWQFIFGCTGHNAVSYAGMVVSKIFGFGGVGWGTPSTMAKTGHLYAFDASQNAIFPATIKATQIIKTGGTSSQFLKADGSVDSNTYATTSQLPSLPLSIANGGTGATTAKAAEYNILSASATNEITTEIGDTYRIPFLTTSPSTTNGIIWGYRTASKIWNYIKSKISSVLGIGGSNGVPTAPTAAAGTNTTQIATTEFVNSAINGIVNNNIVKLNGRSGQYGVTPRSLCASAISTSAILEIIEPFTTTGGINGKPVRQGVAFPIGCKIYYHPDYNDISANTDFTSKEFYSTYDDVDARYTAVTGQNISLYSSSQSGVYLRVTVNNGYWSPYYKPNDTTEIIVTPHDFQTGNFYIYLGKTVGSTGYKFQLEDNNPLYYYDGTKLIDWATYQASEAAPSYTAGDGISISNGVISCTPRPYKKEVFTAVSFNASSAYQKGWQNFVASSNLEVGTYKVTLQVHLYIVSNTDNMMPAGCVVNAYMRSKATASSNYQYIMGATETFSGGVLPETSIPTGRGIISKALNVVGFMEITGDEDSGCSLEVGFTTNSSLNVMIGNPTPLDGSYAGLCSGNDFVLLEKIA